MFVSSSPFSIYFSKDLVIKDMKLDLSEKFSRFFHSQTPVDIR